ncbi:MAG: helix-turn-helix transcriptional regulator [Marinosulfonomonas sp.]
MPKRYINFHQLSEKLGGRSRTSIYRDVAAKRLPKPLKIGHRSYWDDAEIENFIHHNGEAT